MSFFKSRSLWVREAADGSAELQFDPSESVVRLDFATLDDVDEALNRIEREGRFRRLVIRSLREGSFCQGPDSATWHTLDLDRWAERGQALFTWLRKWPTPTVAWVEGACLGPGFELALACRNLVVVDRPATVLGYSEVDVGLVPSWGGNGPLLARIGLEAAFPLVLAGRRLIATEAARLGVVDRLVPREATIPTVLEAPTGRRRSWRQLAFETAIWGRRFPLPRGIERVQKHRLAADLPGPSTALGILRAFAEEGDEAGRAAARKEIVLLGKSAAFENLLRFHELRDRAVPEKRDRRHTVGIVGATPLGMHFVLESIRRGDQVVLHETDAARLGLAIMTLMKSLNTEIKAGRLQAATTHKMLARIRSSNEWKHWDEVDLAIDTRAKGDEADIAQAAPKSALLVTTSLGGRLGDAKRFGIRVAEPFGSSAAVELRHGPNSAKGAILTMREWLGSLGWVPIEVADRPGLLLTRIWLAAWRARQVLPALREEAKSRSESNRRCRSSGSGRRFSGRSIGSASIGSPGWLGCLRLEMPRIPFEPDLAGTGRKRLDRRGGREGVLPLRPRPAASE